MLVKKDLTLKELKTEYMVVTPKRAKQVVDISNIRVRVGEVTIQPKESVRNLGAVLVSPMSMETQIATVDRAVGSPVDHQNQMSSR